MTKWRVWICGYVVTHEALFKHTQSNTIVGVFNQCLAIDLIVLSLGKSSGAGESDEAYAADGANLHVYVALVKIAEGDPGAFEDLIQSVLIELANKLRAKDHKFRQQVSF